MSTKTAGQEAALRLRELIVKGEYPPGLKLDEAWLAKKLGVSRTPLREALFVLEMDGLVESQPYRGRFVKEVDLSVIRDLFPIIGALEATAIRTTEHFDERTLRRLETLNRSIGEPSATKKQRHALDDEWHSVLVRPCDNQPLKELLSKQRALATRYDGGAMRGIADVDRATQDHSEILLLLKKGALTEAADCAETHWTTGVQVIETWLAAQAGE